MSGKRMLIIEAEFPGMPVEEMENIAGRVSCRYPGSSVAYRKETGQVVVAIETDDRLFYVEHVFGKDRPSRLNIDSRVPGERTYG